MIITNYNCRDCPGKAHRSCGGCCTKAGKQHGRKSAPDHKYYAKVKASIDGKRAALSEALAACCRPYTCSTSSVTTRSSTTSRYHEHLKLWESEETPH